MANSFTTTAASGSTSSETIATSTLTTLATSPRKTTTDEGSVEERPIDEVIKADQYTRANEIGDEPLHGLRMSRFKPAGPV